MKRIISIFTIISILLFSMYATYAGSFCVYADTAASDDDRQSAAICAYFNYRGGYFVDQAGGKNAAIALVRTYLAEFYTSSANTTSIKSTTDFIQHIVVHNNDGKWSIKLDNDGIVFLDHLCKWLLGKNEFPNLYSGGSWTDNNINTSDNIYQGFSTSGNLYYIAEITNDTNYKAIRFNNSDVNFGSIVGGITGDLIFNEYMSGINVSTSDFFNLSKSNEQLNLNNYTYTETVNYASDLSLSYVFQRIIDQRSSYRNYVPYLGVNQGLSFNSTQTMAGVQAVTALALSGYSIKGNPAWIMLKNTTTGINHIYVGWVGVDYTNHNIVFWLRQKIENKTPVTTQINFNTNSFDRNDVGMENQQNAPDVNFTPKEQSGNTYNYYTTNDYSEKTFIDTYIEKYTEQKTIIEGSNAGDPNQGGGSGELPTPTNGSGSITPDGNGGYNFNLPDIGIPDFSTFNFNISGLSQKFPFSIPFDLMAFFTVLNAPPETPKLQGQIDLGIVDWDIDWDLHDFDTLAALLRNLEFIGFCIALILITRKLIKG